MYIKSIISVINGKCSKEFPLEYNKIVTDSKEVEPGDIFLAINNGHLYLDDALKRGAIALITEQAPINDSCIYVDSTVAALGKIASFYKEHYQKPVIAITGSTGKTTTKEFISTILSSKYRVLKSIGNQNNHLGMPQTLLKLNDDIDYVVLELGMNHFKEISYLSRICKPNYAIITNIGTAHIGNLGSKDNILKAKLEILDGMDKGYLIVNGYDQRLKKVKSKKVQVIKTHKCKHVKYFTNKTEFDYKIGNKYIHMTLPMSGKHILEDALLAIEVALLCGVDVENIKTSLKKLANMKGRFSVYEKDFTIIDDTYNSSYDSLKESLRLLKKYKKHKIIVLGSMLEFGKYSLRYHKKINNLLRKIKNKDVLLFGDETKVIKGQHFTSLLSLQTYLSNHVKANDVVFIKGSHSMHLDRIVTYLKNKV